MYMENRFIRAGDVAQELNVSKLYAYKLIRKLNEELKAQGFITIAGRVNRRYDGLSQFIRYMYRMFTLQLSANSRTEQYPLSQRRTAPFLACRPDYTCSFPSNSSGHLSGTCLYRFPP